MIVPIRMHKWGKYKLISVVCEDDLGAWYVCNDGVYRYALREPGGHIPTPDGGPCGSPMLMRIAA